ncbi:HDOD domain-containing protein [Thauera linaloolentis]|uniref:Serine/threonine protein kinase n=1 Tax=Thauera linaloolentis (strain DSM 12138 / JCM 21573 / CCUG 41526 / CIP 105981 / IAM 15112 / NBRC 102519 / 47Lol) TaxID=1123367 RepID=N6Z3H5_THAL4|nr:HDOD domain-containing protein [Thauera linaloolentis]ENO88888.1 serine/threonine protein kinase [Thauera linaloolentis 47Lol = DSM 12138]MCM8564817.1 HDOD domain-containing protein [Thauera linaloolentis]
MKNQIEDSGGRHARDGDAPAIAPPPADDGGALRHEAAHQTSRNGALDFLLRRMRHRRDFPALSESVAAINRIATDEAETIGTLSNLILRDFSLTNKLLRLVNSAHYRPAAGGQVSTVSRAVIVLGFDTVRDMAITMLLFEHLQNGPQARQLREAFLHTYLAGLFARGLAARLRTHDLEQAFICATFHNLGRLLSQFYFAEESEDIRLAMKQFDCSEDVAAQRVLGVSFEDLGIGIARSWGFPALILDSMRRPPEGAVRKPATAAERLRALSACANACCDAITRLVPAEQDQALQAIAGRFADAVPLDADTVRELMQAAVGEAESFAQAIRLGAGETGLGRQLAAWAARNGQPAGAQAPGTLPASALLEQGLIGESGPAGQKPADAQAVLSSGIQDISNTLVEDFKLNDVLRIILETMYRAMGFKHVLLCIRDAHGNTMSGRFGFGPGAAELAKNIRFGLSAQPDDVFGVAAAKGVDILISDIDDPGIAARVPAWYRKSMPSHTFVLFPLMINNRAVALIYADKDNAGEIEIGGQELALLRTLRNQAVLAIRQAG